MTTTLTRAPRMIVLLDEDTPTPSATEPEFVEFDLATGMREPTYVRNGRAYWIGPDATVSTWIESDFEGLTGVLDRSGWMARTGAQPSASGLVVAPHDDDVPRGPLQRHGTLFTLWEYAREAMLTDREN